MADYYLQFSETLDTIKPEEEKWLREQLAADPDTDCPAFLLDYEDRDPDDPDYGFDGLSRGKVTSGIYGFTPTIMATWTAWPTSSRSSSRRSGPRVLVAQLRQYLLQAAC